MHTAVPANEHGHRTGSIGAWHRSGVVAFLRFEQAVQEIFAVRVMHSRFPEMLEWTDEKVGHSYVLPDEALKDVSPHPEKAGYWSRTRARL